jgi:DNA-binding NtrC family response regulator
MQRLYDAITRVAATQATVLVVGESGTGKELVAQTIHQLSSRSAGPLVAVNCGAIPETLIESELFGHERGAFTGATQRRKGVFERAHGGTLFLDEISEMPLELQVRLLRVLETERFTRIGGEGEQDADVRVIAATNRDPAQALADGRLREDLLYRLCVFPIHVPPLRDREQDIDLLARHFLEEINRTEGQARRWNPAVLAAFADHHWPGNVRELRNVVWRSYIMGNGSLDTSLAPRFHSSHTRRPDINDDDPATLHIPVGTPLEQIERQFIFATLRLCDDNKRRTAQTLGISLKTLYNRLNAYAQEAGPGPSKGPAPAARSAGLEPAGST